MERGGILRPIWLPVVVAVIVIPTVAAPVADAATAEEVVRAAEARGDRPTQILALAPTRPHFLDRWAGDMSQAQAEARHTLEVTVASLRHEHVDARSEVGDSDTVLAIEDALREFPADEVVLATGTAEDDPDGRFYGAARRALTRVRVRGYPCSCPPSKSISAAARDRTSANASKSVGCRWAFFPAGSRSGSSMPTRRRKPNRGSTRSSTP